jgi:hypothetical protein
MVVVVQAFFLDHWCISCCSPMPIFLSVALLPRCRPLAQMAESEADRAEIGRLSTKVADLTTDLHAARAQGAEAAANHAAAIAELKVGQLCCLTDR